MRANGFKKALILAAAAFVTAVIGIGGAKLKVQAATYLGSTDTIYTEATSGQSPLISDPDIYLTPGMTISDPSYHEWKILYFNTNFTPTISSTYDSSNFFLPTPGTATVNSLPSTSYNFWYVYYCDPSTYVALLIPANVEFTIRFFDGVSTTPISSNTVAYGVTPTAPADPTKPTDAANVYTFAGWSPVIAPATADRDYTATYTATPRTYTVTWKNYDGSVLETDAAVAYGDLPTYDGATPSRPDDETYTYTFSRWEPTVQVVTGDATYTAVFLEDPKPATGGGEDDSSSSSGDDGSNSGSNDGSNNGNNGGTNGATNGANGNRAPKTGDNTVAIYIAIILGLAGIALTAYGKSGMKRR